MVGTIVPVVHGERASGHQPLAHLVHLAGSVLGAAALGLGLGFVGQYGRAGSAAATTATALVAAAYMASRLGLLQVPAPQRHVQVPASWRSRVGPYTMSFGYGLALGSGVLTHIWGYAAYPVLVWIALSAGPVGGLIAWSAFGLGRALPVVVIASRTRDIDATFAVATRLEIWSKAIRLVDALLLATAAGLFTALALDS